MNEPLIDPSNPADLAWLTQLARGLLRDSHAADDLVQETLVVALQGSPPAGAGRRPWLGGVARHLAQRGWRGDRRRQRREAEVARSEALPDSAELVERAELIEELSGLLRGLPEPYRRTLLLHYLDGHSSDVIAKREDIAVDSIRWRLRRGRELLRAELERRHGSSWSALLLPLLHDETTAALTLGSKAVSSSGTVGPLPLLTSFSLLMKTTFWIAALCTTGLWVAWSVARPSGTAVTLDAPKGPQAPAAKPLTTAVLEPVGDRTAIAAETPAETTVLQAAQPAWRARLVNETGQPVSGAKIFVRAQEQARDQAEGPWISDPLATSDAEGRVALLAPEIDGKEAQVPLFVLGIAASGYLDEKRENIDLRPNDREELIVLLRGAWLTGLVVDPQGRPVPDLDVVGHSRGAGIDHVSPSQSLLRIGRATLSGQFQSCRARTDERGEITLSGLPNEEIRLRSNDPAWYLGTEVLAGGPYQVWTAYPVLGVQVQVLDARTGAPASKVNATFRMQLTMTDGSEEDFGQWVGRGRDLVSYRLLPEHLPQLDLSLIQSFGFYGTVTYGQREENWQAPVIEANAGLAKVSLRIDPEQVGSATIEGDLESDTEEQPWLTCELTLDVRREDGRPVERQLIVEWNSRREGASRSGQLELASASTGRYRVELPAGEIGLSLREWGSSGSLSPTTQQLRCQAGGRRLVSLVLPEGATATLVRPRGWSGQWFVRASRRSDESEDWFGSWGYSTPEEELVLRALKPGEWRFELRANRTTALGVQEPDDEQVLVRVLRLESGEHGRSEDSSQSR